MAQELNCNVVVNADQIQTTERAVFKDMQTAISQFMSTRKWTKDEFAPEERINCNIIITLNDNQNSTLGNYTATVQIQSARPVYNTNYESILLNFADREWEFEYLASQPMDYSDNNYINNLTSMLAYYAYIIIGLDYDSFGKLDGTPYFQKARDIVNNAQNANRQGWDSRGNLRNRYWLIDNLTNQQMTPIREGLYTYHRQALDIFDQNAESSRTKVLEVLRDINKVKTRYPNSILLISFMDAKADELVNIFSDGNLQVKREAFDLLVQLDPTKSDKFSKIIGK